MPEPEALKTAAGLCPLVLFFFFRFFFFLETGSHYVALGGLKLAR